MSAMTLRPKWRLARGIALLTFTLVNVAWVFFRAPDFARASVILAGMGGHFGVGHAITLRSASQATSGS